jgi:hypothetical protein
VPGAAARAWLGLPVFPATRAWLGPPNPRTSAALILLHTTAMRGCHPGRGGALMHAASRRLDVVRSEVDPVEPGSSRCGDRRIRSPRPVCDLDLDATSSDVGATHEMPLDRRRAAHLPADDAGG